MPTEAATTVPSTDQGTSALNPTDGNAGTQTALTGATDSPASQSPSDAPSDDAPKFSQADLNRIIARETKKAREAAQQEAQSAAQAAQMTEVEREKKRADDLEARIRDTEAKARSKVINASLMMAVSAPSLNARDAEAVLALVDREALDVDEADQVTGIEAELGRIKKKHPALFYATTADGAAMTRSGAVEVTPGLSRISAAFASGAGKK